MEPSPGHRCPNCEEPRTGRYCARCGQDNQFPRLSLVAALTEFVSASLGFEGRVWQTIRGLTTRPGVVVRDYLDGRRALYVHPIRYAFLSCALWWGVLSAVVSFASAEEQAEAEHPLIRYGSWLNLAMVPILAIPIWMIYFDSRRTWLETCYGLLLITGHVFLWRAQLSLSAALVPSSWEPYVALVDQVVATGYLTWGLWGFHRGVRFEWVRLPLAIAAVLVVSSWLVDAALWAFGLG